MTESQTFNLVAIKDLLFTVVKILKKLRIAMNDNIAHCVRHERMGRERC